MKNNHTLKHILSLGSLAEIDDTYYLELSEKYLKMPFRYRRYIGLNDRLLMVNGKALFNYASIRKVSDLMLYYNEPK